MFTEGLERKWDFKFYYFFKNILYISYKQCIEHDDKIYA